jgi:hypothetical protein
MNLSNTQRLLKLSGSLCRCPRHIMPYIKNNLVNRAAPIKLGVPWWSYSAIEAYDQFLAQPRNVFEWGSGGSTIFAAERGATMTCVEDSGKWMEYTQKELWRRKLDRVNWLHRPLPFPVTDPSQLQEYLNALSKSDYDVIIIDGHDRPFSNRDFCLRHAETFAHPRMLVILDDAWRYDHLIKSSRASRIEVFESTGPGRFGVTSTAFLWY